MDLISISLWPQLSGDHLLCTFPKGDFCDFSSVPLGSYAFAEPNAGSTALLLEIGSWRKNMRL